MIKDEKIPTTITSIVETPSGSVTQVVQVKDLSMDDLMNYASFGEPAALYELRARLQQNSQN